jgi:hypothetical protein
MSKSFSHRVLGTPNKFPQIFEMDEDLKNGLYNVIFHYLIDPGQTYRQNFDDSEYYPVYESVWINFWKKPFDEISGEYFIVIAKYKEAFLKTDYAQVYDLIEFLLSNEFVISVGIVDSLNIILEREFAAYRIIDNLVTPIINKEEIDAVKSAIIESEKAKFGGATIHLKEALSKLSDRTSPDYRNSFKESISAIESISQVIAGKPHASLGDAMKILKTKIELHPALEKGFLNIYGYASDGDGIRHALWDESNVQQEDAIFMLVTASAFINYLLVKTDKFGL